MSTEGEGASGLAPDYEVGNKKPPKHSQFKPGQSGNSKRRPKGSVNLRTRVTQQLRQTVMVTRNGRSVKMRKADLIALQIVDTAAKAILKQCSWLSASMTRRTSPHRQSRLRNPSSCRTGKTFAS
jgi:hypothetical protein